MSEIRAGFNIDKEIWEVFKQKAEEDGTNATDLMKMFVLRFIAGDIKRGFIVRQTIENKEAQSSND